MSTKDQYWLEQIQLCRESGLTDRQWCFQNQISPSTFYYHVQSLRKKACVLPEAAHLASQTQEVVQVNFNESRLESVPSHYNALVPALRLSIDDISIEIMNQAEEKTIIHTIRALRQLC